MGLVMLKILQRVWTELFSLVTQGCCGLSYIKDVPAAIGLDWLVRRGRRR